MKNKFHRLLSLLIIVTLVTISVAKGPAMQVQASVSSEELAQTYLNVICKFLYLGETGKSQFDFNINKDVLQKDATYHWYINKERGNPKAIKINSKTGVVTAKSVGTAYIGCKITLKNREILKPEAKIIVRNNIIGVEINNIPDDKTLPVGTTMDFNETIVNTVAGVGVEASGITRWEIQNDTANVEITDTGVVIPKKIGSFRIRAICFQSELEYGSWLANTVAKADYITAQSEWVTITVVESEGVAETEEQLKLLLATKNIKHITFSSKKKQDITIPLGDYSDKTLVLTASNTNIKNYGLFQKIEIKSSSVFNWEENAINNSFVIYDSDIDLTLSESALVKSLQFCDDNLKSDTSEDIPMNIADVKVSGTLNKIDIVTASKIVLFGYGRINQVTIEDTAKDTKLATSIDIDLVANSNCVVSILKGAEDSIVYISPNTSAIVENLLLSKIRVYSNTGYELLYGCQSLQVTSSGGFIYLGRTNISSVTKLTPSIEYVNELQVTIGQKLWDYAINGSLLYNDIKIEGTFTWNDPSTTVVNSTGNYLWTFTPADSNHYNKVIGHVKVTAVP